MGAVFSVGAALLLPSLAARAGHYAVSYANGQMTATHNGMTSAPVNYILQSDNTWGGSIVAAFMGGYGSSGPQSGSAQCSGKITVTGQWMTDYPNEPPPDSVIVTQTCSAGWSGTVMNCTPTGNADNGLGSPLVVNADGSIGSSSGTTYQVMAGSQTISFSCSPSASLSGVGTSNPTTGGTGSVYVSYKTLMNPASITITGANGISVLIGQFLNAGLDAYSGTLSNWQWSVSGDPFAGFQVINHPTAVPPVTTGKALELTPAMLSQPALDYCYRSIAGGGQGPAQSVITCTATITFPNGVQNQVTAHTNLNVFAPAFTFKPSTGTVSIVPVGNQRWLQGNGDPVGNRGITWTGSAIADGRFVGQGIGSWAFAQLITPTFFYTLLDGSQHNDPDNGKTGLDEAFTYSGTYLADGNFYNSGDSPGLPLQPTVNTATMSCSFQTWMLYMPPDAGNGTSWVPLHRLDWKALGNVNRDANGKVLASGVIVVTGDQDTQTLPQWMQVLLPQSF